MTLLALFDASKKNWILEILETLVSTFGMSLINSAQFPLFFAYISEMFPVRMRGLANAVVLFLSKLGGSLAPEISLRSKRLNLHVLSGCSFITFLSLPLSFLLKETLIIDEVGDDDLKGDIGIDGISDIC